MRRIILIALLYIAFAASGVLLMASAGYATPITIFGDHQAPSTHVSGYSEGNDRV